MEYGYKGFKNDLKCRNYQYKLGEWNYADFAECHRGGLHCAINPLDCISNGYSFDGSNRFFRVALDGTDGDIHQDDGSDTQLAGTKMYLVKELTLEEFVVCAMNFIYEHPWYKYHYLVKHEISVTNKEKFTIVVGENPTVVASVGTVCGLVQVDNNRNVIAMNMFTIGTEGFKPLQTYNIDGKPVVQNASNY